MNPAVDYAFPRDPVEIWLTLQWREVLGFNVGIRENFFGIGGNSLDAARIINAVLDEFGVQLPLNVMAENPTVESLAIRLRDQNEHLSGPLIEIQHGDGTCPPLFLVHPANGQVASYCHLADALGDEFTLFGLQAVGLYRDTDPLRTVPEMARTYLDAIRLVLPTGPYILGGCGTGAAIAYEMATQLAGAEVRLLAAIDLELVEPADPAPHDETPEFVARSLRVRQANHDAIRDWQPRPYSGPLDIFRDPAGVATPVLNWPATVTQRVHECAGAPAQQLAAELRKLIGS
jgi:thioesterase domain-containing protein